MTQVPLASGGQDYAGGSDFIPERSFRTVICGEAISKGEILTFCVPAAEPVAPDGVTAYLADNYFDDPTTYYPFVIGVAIEDGATGQQIRVQVGGVGLVDLVTNGGVAVGESLVPSTTAGACDGSATEAGYEFGVAYADDSSTTLAAANYFLFCKE